jgi:hypothetical protein
MTETSMIEPRLPVKRRHVRICQPIRDETLPLVLRYLSGTGIGAKNDAPIAGHLLPLVIDRTIGGLRRSTGSGCRGSPGVSLGSRTLGGVGMGAGSLRLDSRSSGVKPPPSHL